jgi:NADP-dependent 3-hydroxy acid dehydrogenase YdfG
MRKIAVVTGATSGIGRATALKLASNNYDLIITGRREERLIELEKELQQLGASVLRCCFDVRDFEQVKTHLGELSGRWAEIDVLVNNAGGALGKEPIQDGDIEDWDTMIDTNIKGLLYVTKVLVPQMCKNKKGHIVNLCSISGKQVYAEGNVYCAAKHAVDAISKGIRIDALPYGIKVTNVCPGAVETEFSIVRFHGDLDKAAATYKGFQPLTGEDIAETIYYCVSLPAHVCINDLTIMPTAQADSGHFFKN